MPLVADTLPNNFPSDFLPDRRLLTDLLGFTSTGGKGTKEEISEQTGIPTGKSSGKVEPMIHYATGMGLITATKKNQIWQLDLTSLGDLVYTEDTFLSEPQTLWLLHLLLCRRSGLSTPAKGVATVWFELFTNEQLRLREYFTLSDYHAVLVQQIGDMGYVKGLASLAVRTYFTDNCWALTEALKQQQNDKEHYQFSKAPLEKEMLPVYATYLYWLWDELFHAEQQLSLDDFNTATGFFKVTSWGDADISLWLNYLSDNGLVQVDRYTGVPMLLRLRDTQQVINNLYCELI